MELDLLRRFARWADKIAVAERQLADELAGELRDAEHVDDPLGRHMLKARQGYLRVSRTDKSKTEKRVERQLEQSYREAMSLGFNGDFALWVALMRMGKNPQDNGSGDSVVRITGRM